MGAGRKDKIADVPIESGGDGHLSGGEFVDDRPLFRQEGSVFPNCRRGKRYRSFGKSARADSGRISGVAAEGTKVLLGPSIVGGPVLARKLGGFKQNAVAIGTALSRIGTEEK
jgi:hypothetical protein